MSTPQDTPKWKRRQTINVKAPQEVAYGPGHKPRRIRHVAGPICWWTAGAEKRTGTLVKGDVMELQDFTTFRVEKGTGTAMLELEEAR